MMPFDTEPGQQRYRVAIIGGGPAGSACALALTQRGVADILMLEAGDYSQFRIGESIPPETWRALQALGIAQAFVQEGHAPCYGSCSYWGSDKRGYNDTLMNPLGHGWHLDRCKFDRFLATQAHNQGVHVITQARLAASTPTAQAGFLLDVALGGPAARRRTRLQVDFVVDASGTRAVFARQRGSRKRGTNPLVCLAAPFAILDREPQRSSLTHLEAVEHGWWYGAHVPDARVLLAFYTDAATVKAQRLQHPQRWMTLLEAAVNSARLLHHTAPLSGGILSFPVPSYCLAPLYGAGWLAIGDAASAYDPIMSQGIHKALANGVLAAETISTSSGGQRFAHSVATAYQHYVSMRRYVYGLEQRWPEAPFWKEQHDN